MSVRLIDSSVWIEFLRGGRSTSFDAMQAYLTQGVELGTTQPVAMELRSVVSLTGRQRAERVLEGVTLLGVDALVDFDEATEIARAVRASGHTVRSSMDCLIAAVALRHEAVLVHKDVDFARIGAVVPDLRTEALFD